ncbi:MAG: Fic/DOC family N-terminal domain-containing protein [Thermoleophilaceae bacterium]
MPQSSGYSAFVPASLPPEPPLELDLDTITLLSEADRALGRLDGMVKTVPDPDFFVAMYVRREAVLSSQIEGTQSTLEDLLAVELEPAARTVPDDVEEIVNYVSAMNHGLKRLDELPLSLRLIREIHRTLLRGGRGAHATPGEFRTTQNWIGPAGSTLADATFVPPPPPEMNEALFAFEEPSARRPCAAHAGGHRAGPRTVRVHPPVPGRQRARRQAADHLHARAARGAPVAVALPEPVLQGPPRGVLRAPDRRSRTGRLGGMDSLLPARGGEHGRGGHRDRGADLRPARASPQARSSSGKWGRTL